MAPRVQPDDAALDDRLDAPEAARGAIVQHALFRIAEAASAVTDLDDFYAEMHAIVGELMDAENCYIALYDAEHAARSTSRTTSTPSTPTSRTRPAGRRSASGRPVARPATSCGSASRSS